MSDLKNKERLDKILSNNGIGTRRDVKHLIRCGKVSVNGVAVFEPEFHADSFSDEICVEGKKLNVEPNAYFMMNKAGGAVCSTKSDRRRTVFEYLSPEDNRMYPGGRLSTVGRLDADTEGLLVITSDGSLIHRVTFPKYEVPKTYLVYLRDVVDDSKKISYEKKLASGIHIAAEGKDGEADCRPAVIEWKDKKLYYTKSGGTPSEVCCLTVTEGKFHEVKRIFKALENEVVYLKRIRINGLFLDETLPEGSYRRLTEDEIRLLDAEEKND
ncbi:pseudouridine synthase [Treponema sp.]|uniref:pseudouridine synthase n=1 Tax=Treponema sp. TaxID=166 RepID=UPI003F012A6F